MSKLIFNVFLFLGFELGMGFLGEIVALAGYFEKYRDSWNDIQNDWAKRMQKYGCFSSYDRVLQKTSKQR